MHSLAAFARPSRLPSRPLRVVVVVLQVKIKVAKNKLAPPFGKAEVSELAPALGSPHGSIHGEMQPIHRSSVIYSSFAAIVFFSMWRKNFFIKRAALSVSQVDLMFGKGFDLQGELLDLGAKFGLVSKSGAW